MIVGADFQPVPPSDITRRLAQISPRLGVKVCRLPGVEGGHWWAYTLAWDANDPRWTRVIHGECGPDEAFDIIGQLPRDAGVEEAYGYFVQAAKAIQGQADKDAILERAVKWLDAPFEAAKAEQRDLVEEDAAKLFRGHYVSTVEEAAKPVVEDGPIKRKAGRPKGSKSWFTKIREAAK